jgi:nucleoside-diphosphate-sugar epimerase
VTARSYLITGASGVVGSALVPILLEEPGTEVHLLLRARSLAHLEARRCELLDYWNLNPGEDTAARIHAHRGDVSAEHLGLSSQEHGALTRRITNIVHAAGDVHMRRSLEHARKTAVGSVRHLVHLAGRCTNLEKLDVLSTVGVGGRSMNPLPERWVPDARDFHNTYEQAKAEAETYLAERIGEGLPATVHRPSMVVGDSRTGKNIGFQVFYFLCEFLSGRHTAGLLPQLGSATVDTVPSDFVARALAWASRNPDTGGQVLHLCSGPGRAMPLADLSRRVGQLWKQHGRSVPRPVHLPRPVYRRMMSAAQNVVPARTRRALGFIPVLLDYLGDEQRFDNARTEQLLASADIEVPNPEHYVEPVLRYYLEHAAR